ncbi:MAG: type II toxin-antitoxin system VapC family toxin [Candidatus Binataceae bacterium]
MDTDTVAYYLREVPAVVKRLEETSTGDRYLSLITVGEIYHGIYNSAQVQKNLLRYRRFFAQTKLLPFTPAVAQRFGEVKAGLQRRGEMIEDNDLWIAAHALEYGTALVTNNGRDFSRIPGLRIENWLR